MTMLRKLTVLSAALASATMLAAPALAQDSIHITNLSYRTGPFAATGTPVMNGQRDYMIMLHERDGGVNGVEIL